MDEKLSFDELLFFDPMPEMLPLYQKVREQLAARCPDLQIKVSKTQIAFRNRYGFATASLPWRKVKNRPAQYLLLSFGLSYQKRDPRIEQATEAAPNRWTHHVVVTAAEQIDDELLSWLLEAYAFSLAK